MSDIATPPSADNAGVIAPPLLLLLAFLAAGLALDWLFPLPFLPRTVQFAAGALFGVAGLALMAAAALRFRAAGTELPPWRPSTAIVSNGPYRFTRNPIYLGFALVFAGIAAAVDGALIFVAGAALMVTIHAGVVRREEAYLERKFGDAYRAYKARVRRWL